MKTIFGVEWPMASQPEILFIIILIIFLGIVVLGIKYYQNLKQLEQHDIELFQFKLKRLGFTNNQIKIINSMISILKLTNPLKLIQNSDLFESALGKYLTFITQSYNKIESKISICRDIIFIFDKLFFPAEFKKPLTAINEIENSQMIYIILDKSEVYFGKIIGINTNQLTIKLFRPDNELQSFKSERDISAYFSRVGDGEYSFSTGTINLVNNILAVKIPEKFSKDKEYRHPYIDVILACTIMEFNPKAVVEPDPINGTIMKINENEVIIRVANKLNYKKNYNLYFELMDYKFSSNATVLANRTVEEENTFYYTFKFIDINEAAVNVLKKFVIEHL